MYDFDEPLDRTNAIFLSYRDRLIEKIESNETIKNSFAVNRFLSQFGITGIRKIPKMISTKDLPDYPKRIEPNIKLRDQVLLRYLHLWFIVNKILLFESSRYHNNEIGFSTALLQKRHMRLADLLLKIGKFLDKNYGSSSSNVEELTDRAKELNEWYEAYMYRYKELRFGKLRLDIVIWTAYNVFSQTRKDASEVSKITLKQVRNRLKPFVDENNKLDVEKLRKILIAKSADDELFANHGHLEWLQYVMQAREELEQTTRRLKQPKKSSIYRKTKNRVRKVFPEMTIDP